MYNRYEPYQYNRSNKTLPPPPHLGLTKPPLPKPPQSKKSPKKKITFKSLKKDTCTSLNDVEYFLNNFSHTLKYIKLINLLK